MPLTTIERNDIRTGAAGNDGLGHLDRLSLSRLDDYLEPADLPVEQRPQHRANVVAFWKRSPPDRLRARVNIVRARGPVLEYDAASDYSAAEKAAIDHEVAVNGSSHFTERVPRILEVDLLDRKAITSAQWAILDRLAVNADVKEFLESVLSRP